MNISSASIASEHLSSGGLRVEFRHAGSGPALVLVHGLLGYSFSWRRVIPLLAGEWEVFAPDMPGAGFSECPGNSDCRLASAALRLTKFLDAAGISSCHLVGSSYGGTTAVLATALDPSRILSLTLVSPANPWSRIGRKRLALLRNSVMARLFPRLARAVHPVHRYFVRRMWGDPRRITPETLDGYARPLTRPGIFEHATRIVRTWRSDMSEVEKTLREIANVPTLLVWGSKDGVVDPESAKALKRAMPGARVVMIEGAGHLPYEECPEQFSQILLDFLHSTHAHQPVKSSVQDVT